MKQSNAPEEAVAIGGVIATILVALGVINSDQVQDVSRLIANVITGGIALFAIYHLTSQIIQNKHDKWMAQNTQTPAQTVPPQSQP